VSRTALTVAAAAVTAGAGAAAVGVAAGGAGVAATASLATAAAAGAGGHWWNRRRNRRRHHRTPTTLSAAEQTEQQLNDLAATVAAAQPPVADAVTARIDNVTRIVRETLPRLDQFGPGSVDAYTVMATATSYLPEAVGAYLRLPRRYADTRPISGSKTSLMLLCDQLDLLAVHMERLHIAANQADANALIAHGRFLAEKFATGALALDPNARTLPTPHL
jgi:hypothetical protein